MASSARADTNSHGRMERTSILRGRKPRSAPTGTADRGRRRPLFGSASNWVPAWEWLPTKPRRANNVDLPEFDRDSRARDRPANAGLGLLSQRSQGTFPASALTSRAAAKARA
jgi:hypothetical protein